MAKGNVNPTPSPNPAANPTPSPSAPPPTGTGGSGPTGNSGFSMNDSSMQGLQNKAGDLGSRLSGIAGGLRGLNFSGNALGPIGLFAVPALNTSNDNAVSQADRGAKAFTDVQSNLKATHTTFTTTDTNQQSNFKSFDTSTNAKPPPGSANTTAGNKTPGGSQVSGPGTIKGGGVNTAGNNTPGGSKVSQGPDIKGGPGPADPGQKAPGGPSVSATPNIKGGTGPAGAGGPKAPGGPAVSAVPNVKGGGGPIGTGGVNTPGGPSVSATPNVRGGGGPVGTGGSKGVGGPSVGAAPNVKGGTGPAGVGGGGPKGLGGPAVVPPVIGGNAPGAPGSARPGSTPGGKGAGVPNVPGTTGPGGRGATPPGTGPGGKGAGVPHVPATGPGGKGATPPTSVAGPKPGVTAPGPQSAVTSPSAGGPRGATPPPMAPGMAPPMAPGGPGNASGGDRGGSRFGGAGGNKGVFDAPKPGTPDSTITKAPPNSTSTPPPAPKPGVPGPTPGSTPGATPGSTPGSAGATPPATPKPGSTPGVPGTSTPGPQSAVTTPTQSGGTRGGATPPPMAAPAASPGMAPPMAPGATPGAAGGERGGSRFGGAGGSKGVFDAPKPPTPDNTITKAPGSSPSTPPPAPKPTPLTPLPTTITPPASSPPPQAPPTSSRPVPNVPPVNSPPVNSPPPAPNTNTPSPNANTAPPVQSRPAPATPPPAPSTNVPPTNAPSTNAPGPQSPKADTAPPVQSRPAPATPSPAPNTNVPPVNAPSTNAPSVNTPSPAPNPNTSVPPANTPSPNPNVNAPSPTPAPNTNTPPVNAPSPKPDTNAPPVQTRPTPDTPPPAQTRPAPAPPVNAPPANVPPVNAPTNAPPANVPSPNPATNAPPANVPSPAPNTNTPPTDVPNPNTSSPKADTPPPAQTRPAPGPNPNTNPAPDLVVAPLVTPAPNVHQNPNPNPAPNVVPRSHPAAGNFQAQTRPDGGRGGKRAKIKSWLGVDFVKGLIDKGDPTPATAPAPNPNPNTAPPNPWVNLLKSNADPNNIDIAAAKAEIDTAVNNGKPANARVLINRLQGTPQGVELQQHYDAAVQNKGDAGKVEVPKQLHFAWFGKTPTPESVNGMVEWAAQTNENNGWKATLWTDGSSADWDPAVKQQLADAGIEIKSDVDSLVDELSNQVPPAGNNTTLKDVYTAAQNPDAKAYNLAADIARYAVLAKNGGVYVDVDIRPGAVSLDNIADMKMQPTDVPVFAPRLRDQASVGNTLQGQPDVAPGTEIDTAAEIQYGKGELNNNFIVAPPNNDFIKAFADIIPKKFEGLQAFDLPPAQFNAELKAQAPDISGPNVLVDGGLPPRTGLIGQFTMDPDNHGLQVKPDYLPQPVPLIEKTDFTALFDPDLKNKWTGLEWVTPESESQLDTNTSADTGSKPGPSNDRSNPDASRPAPDQDDGQKTEPKSEPRSDVPPKQVRGGGAPPPMTPPTPESHQGKDVLTDESWRHDPARTADWFAPNDPVDPSTWADRRDDQNVRTVEQVVRDVRTDSTPSTPQSYHGLINYDLRRIETSPGKFVQEYTVKVHVEPGANTDPKVVEQLKENAANGVDTLLNQGFRLPSGDQFHLNLEFTENKADAHTSIKADQDKNTDQTNWKPDTSPAVLAHEALHYLGIPDESKDTSRVLLQHDTNTGVHQNDGGMMGQDVHGPDPGLRPRHLWLIERTANSQVMVPDTRLEPPGPATVPPPPPGSLPTPQPQPQPQPNASPDPTPNTAPDANTRPMPKHGRESDSDAAPIDDRPTKKTYEGPSSNEAGPSNADADTAMDVDTATPGADADIDMDAQTDSQLDNLADQFTSLSLDDVDAVYNPAFANLANGDTTHTGSSTRSAPEPEVRTRPAPPNPVIPMITLTPPEVGQVLPGQQNLPAFFQDNKALGTIAPTDVRGAEQVTGAITNLKPADAARIQQALNGDFESFLDNGRNFQVKIGNTWFEANVRATMEAPTTPSTVDAPNVKVDAVAQSGTSAGTTHTVATANDIGGSATAGVAMGPYGSLGGKAQLATPAQSQGTSNSTTDQRAIRAGEGSTQATVGVTYDITLTDANGDVKTLDPVDTGTDVTLQIPNDLATITSSGNTFAAVTPPDADWGTKIEHPAPEAVSVGNQQKAFKDVAAKLHPSITKVGSPGREALQNFLSPTSIRDNLGAMLGGAHVTSPDLVSPHASKGAAVQMKATLQTAELVGTHDTSVLRLHDSASHSSGVSSTTKSGFDATAGFGGNIGVPNTVGGQVGATVGYSARTAENVNAGTNVSHKSGIQIKGETGLYKVTAEVEVRTPSGANVKVPVTTYLRLGLPEAGALGLPTPDGTRNSTVDESNKGKKFPPPYMSDALATGNAKVGEFETAAQVQNQVESALRGLPGFDKFLPNWNDPNANPRSSKGKDFAGVAQQLANQRLLTSQLSPTALRANMDSLMGPGVQVQLKNSGKTSNTYVNVTVKAKVTNPQHLGQADARNVREASSSGPKLDSSTTTTKGWSGGLEGRVRIPAKTDVASLTPSPQVGVKYNHSWSDRTSAGPSVNSTSLNVGSPNAQVFRNDVEFEVEITTFTRPRAWVRRVVPGAPGFHAPETNVVARTGTGDADLKPIRGEVNLWVSDSSTLDTDPGNGFKPGDPEVKTLKDAPTVKDLLSGPKPREKAPDFLHVEAVANTTALRDQAIDALNRAAGGDSALTVPGTASRAQIDRMFSPENIKANLRKLTETGMREPGLKYDRRVTDRTGAIGMTVGLSNPRLVSISDDTGTENAHTGGYKAGESSSTSRSVDVSAGINIPIRPNTTSPSGSGGVAAAATVKPWSDTKSSANEIGGSVDRNYVTPAGGRTVLVQLDADVTVVGESRATNFVHGGTPRAEGASVNLPKAVFVRVTEDVARDMGLLPDVQPNVPKPDFPKMAPPSTVVKGEPGALGLSSVESVPDLSNVVADLTGQVNDKTAKRFGDPLLPDSVLRDSMSNLQRLVDFSSPASVKAMIDSAMDGGVPLLVHQPGAFGKDSFQVTLRAKAETPKFQEVVNDGADMEQTISGSQKISDGQGRGTGWGAGIRTPGLAAPGSANPNASGTVGAAGAANIGQSKSSSVTNSTTDQFGHLRAASGPAARYSVPVEFELVVEKGNKVVAKADSGKQEMVVRLHADNQKVSGALPPLPYTPEVHLRGADQATPAATSAWQKAGDAATLPPAASVENLRGAQDLRNAAIQALTDSGAGKGLTGKGTGSLNSLLSTLNSENLQPHLPGMLSGPLDVPGLHEAALTFGKDADVKVYAKLVNPSLGSLSDGVKLENPKSQVTSTSSEAKVTDSGNVSVGLAAGGAAIKQGNDPKDTVNIIASGVELRRVAEDSSAVSGGPTDNKTNNLKPAGRTGLVQFGVEYRVVATIGGKTSVVDLSVPNSVGVRMPATDAQTVLKHDFGTELTDAQTAVKDAAAEWRTAEVEVDTSRHEAQQVINEAAAKLARNDSAFTRVQIELNTAIEHHLDEQAKVPPREAAAETARREVARTRDAIADLTPRAGNLSLDVLGAQSQVDDAQIDVDAKAQTLRSLENQLARTPDADGLGRQVDAARQAHADAQTALRTAEAEADAAQTALDQAQHQLADARAELDVQRQEAAARRADLAAQEQAVAQADAARAAAESRHGQAVADLAADRAALEDRIKDAETRLDDARRAADAKQQAWWDSKAMVDEKISDFNQSPATNTTSSSTPPPPPPNLSKDLPPPPPDPSKDLPPLPPDDRDAGSSSRSVPEETTAEAGRSAPTRSAPPAPPADTHPQGRPPADPNPLHSTATSAPWFDPQTRPPQPMTAGPQKVVAAHGLTASDHVNNTQRQLRYLAEDVLRRPTPPPTTTNGLYGAVGEVSKVDPAALRQQVLTLAATDPAVTKAVADFTVSRPMHQGHLYGALVENLNWSMQQDAKENAGAGNARDLVGHLIATRLGVNVRIHQGGGKPVVLEPMGGPAAETVEIELVMDGRQATYRRPAQHDVQMS